MTTRRGRASYWRDDQGLEVMQARFRDHVYPRHSHEAYSFGVTDAGAQTFQCRGATYTSNAGMVMAFNPDEAHDGRAAAELGYHYRIVHIHPSVMDDILVDANDRRPAAAPLFARPVLADPLLARALTRLCDALTRGPDPLVRQERLTEAVLALSRRAATRSASTRAPSGAASRHLAHRARALLTEAYPEPMPVDRLALAVGCSRFSLFRAFHAEFGLAPSDYQRQLRLRHARALLGAGMTIADTAAATGFADQAHLTRWFGRIYGITPATYWNSASRSTA